MGIDLNSFMISLAGLFAGLLTALAGVLGVDVPDMPLPVPRPDGPTVTAPSPDMKLKPFPENSAFLRPVGPPASAH